MTEKIAVIGLGYVGLPLLVGLARHFQNVTGFDINKKRVTELQKGRDWTGEFSQEELKLINVNYTDDERELRDVTLYIVTVPTPINEAKRPDLGPVLRACTTLGQVLKGRKKKGLVPLIVFESTVYPGLTETVCGKKIAEVSGLKQHRDFKLGYSPERINPGDKVNRLEKITKIISAEDPESLDRLDKIYGAVIEAGLYKASSIAVAEAAKVLENTQRDLNIALMNELAIICDKLGIVTHDVLEAAGTKWNFLKFTPGLVGGHCIGVDPYYLTARAEELGYNPQVILAGRRINDTMAEFIAQKIIKLLVSQGQSPTKARVGILGLSFKENVRDIRNSRVPEIITELKELGADVFVHDPVVDPKHAEQEYGLTLSTFQSFKKLDALVLAVPHRVFLDQEKKLWSCLKPKGWVIDIKSVLDTQSLPRGMRYWSL